MLLENHSFHQELTPQIHALDYLINETEIRIAVKKLKNNKSSFSDKIKNEMIKSAVNELMPDYLKLFNTVLRSGIMPQTWCNGIITPIFKSGVKSDINSLKLPWNMYLQLSWKTILFHSEPKIS